MNLSKNTSEKELVDAVKDLLKSNGHLNRLQAEIRAKVTEALKSRQSSLQPDGKGVNPPEPTEEVLLVNELVREYLEWNGYLYTASVMTSEAALPPQKKLRTELCAEVGVKDDERSATLPLLSNIVAAYTERIKRKLSKCKRDD